MKSEYLLCMCCITCLGIAPAEGNQEYDPCSKDNYRKYLSVSQEANMLEGYKQQCHNIHPDRSDQYRAAELQVHAEKHPPGVALRTAEKRDRDSIDPSVTANLHSTTDKGHFQKVVKQGSELFDGMVYDTEDEYSGVGMVYLYQNGKWNPIANADYEELLNTDLIGRKSVMTNAHAFYNPTTGQLRKSFENMRIVFGKDMQNKESIHEIQGIRCAVKYNKRMHDSDVYVHDMCEIKLKTPPPDRVKPTPYWVPRREHLLAMAKAKTKVEFVAFRPVKLGQEHQGKSLGEYRTKQKATIYFNKEALDNNVVFTTADTETGTSGGILTVDTTDLKELFASLPEFGSDFADAPDGIKLKFATNFRVDSTGYHNASMYTNREFLK